MMTGTPGTKKDFPGVGVMPSGDWMGKALDFLPDTLKQKLYSVSGLFDGVNPDRLGEINIEELVNGLPILHLNGSIRPLQ